MQKEPTLMEKLQDELFSQRGVLEVSIPSPKDISFVCDNTHAMFESARIFKNSPRYKALARLVPKTFLNYIISPLVVYSIETKPGDDTAIDRFEQRMIRKDPELGKFCMNGKLRLQKILGVMTMSEHVMTSLNEERSIYLSCEAMLLSRMKRNLYKPATAYSAK